MASPELRGATAAYKMAVVWGEGDAAVAVAQAVAAAPGWEVAMIADPDQASTYGVQSRRLWVAVQRRRTEVEAVMAAHPLADFVVVLGEGSTVADRCRLWELGAVPVPSPVFPREVLAVVRGVWRAAFRHG